jgi:hypothetical protein
MPKKLVVKKPALQKHKVLIHTTVSEPKYSSAFDLFVYQTQQDMSQGIKNWIDSNSMVSTDCDEDDSAGMFIPTRTLEEDDDLLVFGAMFLCCECLSASYIAHECLHAAFANDRRCIRYEGTYGDEWDERTGVSAEERVCYRLESYVNTVIKVCKEAGLSIAATEEDLTKKAEEEEAEENA